MLNIVPHSQGKRSSPAGGRTRSSCGYHHQRHQACHESCEGRKSHPMAPHPPVRDKFYVGCTACHTYFSEQHQESLSPVSKRLQQQSASSPSSPSSPTSPDAMASLHPFTPSKFEEFTSIAVSTLNKPPSPSPQKLATLAHEVEYELLQQHQLDLAQKRRQMEQEEQLLLQYRAQLDKLRQQQDAERQRIQQHQIVLEYQKQQQEMELQRIHQHQRELDDARQILKQQQNEIGQVSGRLEFEQLRLFQKKDGLTIQPPSMFIPMVEKSHSPNPTALASHPMDEENVVHDRMNWQAVHVTSNKRPLSDIMGNEAEEGVSHKAVRRSG